MKPLILVPLALFAATLPALAQFPPPGIYICVDMQGAAFGTLTLQVAEDYDFATKTGIGGTGQVASSGNSINALTGPLADIGLTGSFATDARGEATFTFTTSQGSILCGLPAN